VDPILFEDPALRGAGAAGVILLVLRYGYKFWLILKGESREDISAARAEKVEEKKADAINETIAILQEQNKRLSEMFYDISDRLENEISRRRTAEEAMGQMNAHFKERVAVLEAEIRRLGGTVPNVT
jgi:FtsZ-binding cell division protein ZapB